MKLAVVGAALLAAGGVAVATGVLPIADAAEIGARVWPILLFVVAITIVAELAALAGLFDAIAARLARASRGRTIVLFAFVVALAVGATAFLSLDTTAVLLTPVVIVVARANGLHPLPFAFATVWLANTASLFLPVSNLTNLLAEHRLGGIGPGGFIALLGPSAVVAAAVTILLLGLFFARGLRGRFAPAPAPRVADRTLLLGSAIVVIVLLPMLVSGLEPWIPASVAAIVLGALYAWRAPRAIRPSLVPWPIVVFASGLFLAVGSLQTLGLPAFVAAIAGEGHDLVSLWQLAGVGALASNAINNLPAYVALESAATTPTRIAALLIGVNAGPLITPWASLATLLWHQRAAAAGVRVPWIRYALLGCVVAPLTIALAVVPLAFR